MNISVVLRRHGRLLITALLSVFLTSLLYLIIRQIGTIHKIRVIGNNIRIEINEQKFPTTLLFFPKDKIKRELLDAYPLLSDVTIKRVLPSTLELHTYARIPEAILVSANRLFLVDRDGVVIGDASTTVDLPKIIISNEQIRIASRRTDGLTQTSLQVIHEFSPFLTIRSITATESANIQIQTDITSILITQKSNMVMIVDTLQTLLAGFRIKGTMPRRIDLRFSKPVVIY